MTRPIVTLEGVEKRYGGALVVSVASLAVATGERLQISGRNGSGKSTVLRLLAGVSVPSAGRIERAPKVSIGFVPQLGGLFEELTLAQNIQMLASGRRLGSAVRDELMILMAEFGLKSHLDVPAHALSGGMKRLAIFLCIWVTRPMLFIADEPLAGVDSENAAKLLDLVRRELDPEQTFVFSAHDSIEGSRTVELIEGRL